MSNLDLFLRFGLAFMFGVIVIFIGLLGIFIGLLSLYISYDYLMELIK